MESGKQSGLPNGVGALGSFLKGKREAAGLTLTQLSTELGVSRPYLSRLERGDYSHPSSLILNKIMKRFNVSAEDAFAMTGYTLPSDLPSFGPYVRAKHADWPDGVVQELESFYDYLKYKYALD